MPKNSAGLACAMASLAIGCLTVGRTAMAQSTKPGVVHDSEYYILDAQNGQKWTAEDKALDARLAELRKKYGRPPNIIHFMWDDQPFGAVGIPALQKIRGFETPRLNQLVSLGVSNPRSFCSAGMPTAPNG